MRDSKDVENADIIRRLRAITPLKHLKKADIAGLLQSSKMIRYDPGEIIVEEGQHGNWIYFLITGKVGIRKKGEIITVLDRQGDLFGEMGIIEKSTRSASIAAIDQTVCLAIDGTYSQRLEGDQKTAFDAAIYRIFAEILAERLRSMDEEMVKIRIENTKLRSELKELKV